METGQTHSAAAWTEPGEEQWTTGTPAMQVGNATFNVNDAYAVGFDRNEPTSNVIVSAGDVDFNLGSRSLTVINALNISSGGSLTTNGTVSAKEFNILSGGSFESSAVTSVTENAFNNGQMTISGANSRFNLTNGSLEIGSNGNNLSLNFISAVPEPNSLMLVGLAGLFTGLYRRRRQGESEINPGRLVL